MRFRFRCGFRCKGFEQTGLADMWDHDSDLDSDSESDVDPDVASDFGCDSDTSMLSRLILISFSISGGRLNCIELESSDFCFFCFFALSTLGPRCSLSKK